MSDSDNRERSTLRYLSLFSGIGGLESEPTDPVVCCELDETCWPVLGKRFPSAEIYPDVSTFRPPPADVVTGGWPCQDISVAGKKAGLDGLRSGLFFEMLRIAEDAGVHTIVAENVPRIITMENGTAFERVLESFKQTGLPYVSWRTINAREFGLPQDRNRVFIIASKYEEIAKALHRPVGSRSANPVKTQPRASGFYWTAGIQSLCYRKGYVPALKVGSSIGIPSPPAVHFDGCVRKITAGESLRLQGFCDEEFDGIKDKDIYRMSGKAMAVPVGRFVMDSIDYVDSDFDMEIGSWFVIGPSGYFDGTMIVEVKHPTETLATNLEDYVDPAVREQLSPRAASGLLARLERSGKPCPENL